MKQKMILLLPLIFLSTSVFPEMDIPQAGRIRIDGNLDRDWRRADWIPIETVIQGNPDSISNACWSAAWSDEPFIYIALQYDDSDIALKDGTNATDCVEIYIRADTGSSPVNYPETQESAQQYTIGLAEDKKNTWIHLGTFKKIPVYNRAAAAIKLENNRFTYEIRLPLYDRFDISSRHRCSEAAVFTDKEIGLDIAIIDAGKNKHTGMLGINRRNKRKNADQIEVQRLEE